MKFPEIFRNSGNWQQKIPKITQCLGIAVTTRDVGFDRANFGLPTSIHSRVRLKHMTDR